MDSQPPTAADVVLMAAFAAITGATTANIVKASWCRLYICVITIADLAHKHGRFIPSRRMTGSWRAQSPLNWPDIPQTAPEYFAAFQWCIYRTL